ncbi:MAG: UDP-glucose dehydrogenase family protein [Fimbriimonas sp.]
MKIGVIGTGYVGLVTGVVLADLGNDVICVDIDEKKVAQLRQGIPTIYEPGIEEILKRTIREGYLTFSTDTVEATRASEIVFIAVGTPPGEDGTPDLTYVKAAAAQIASGIQKHTVVVNKSTVPVGSGDLVESIIRDHGVPEDLFDVVSNPEFLREGSAISDTLKPDRIVVGAKRREAALKLVELYAPLESRVFITDLNSAELIKYASNSFLALKISFINAISQVCERCGADVGAVSKGMGSDARIGQQFLYAGLGWGGSCFPKDVLGMVKTAEKLGYDFALLKEVCQINDDQVHRFLDRLESRIGGFKDKTIALLGLAFKPNTDDIRDAKAIEIIERVITAGGSIRAYDPVAMDNVRKVVDSPKLVLTEGAYEVSEGADAVILVTEWNEFKQIDLQRLGSTMKRKVLFDGRRIYDRAVVEKAGFEFETIGNINSQSVSEIRP